MYDARSVLFFNHRPKGFFEFVSKCDKARVYSYESMLSSSNSQSPCTLGPKACRIIGSFRTTYWFVSIAWSFLGVL